LFIKKTEIMELVTLESKAYQMLLAKIAKIEEYIKADDVKPKPSKEQEEIWMDNYDVCQLFHISTKTLQRLRKDELLPYTKLRGKCLYRMSDIEVALNERLINRSPKKLDEFRKNYVVKNTHK